VKSWSDSREIGEWPVVGTLPVLLLGPTGAVRAGDDGDEPAVVTTVSPMAPSAVRVAFEPSVSRSSVGEKSLSDKE
jgi:hypothetical protein